MNEKKGLKGLLIAAVCLLSAAALVLGVLYVWSDGELTAGLRRLRNSLYAATGRNITAALRELREKNPEAEAYVENYRGAVHYDPELDLSAELTGGIPYYTQWDSRWGYCRYGDGLIGYTGCGPTCLALVLMGLTGDGTLTPGAVAAFAQENGYAVPGSGTAWTLFSEGAETLGLTAKELPLWEPTMKKALDAGKPIICVMGPGHFTETGHYIVLTGYTEAGFTVLDPNRPSNNEKAWPYEAIEGEIRNLWCYEFVA